MGVEIFFSREPNERLRMRIILPIPIELGKQGSLLLPHPRVDSWEEYMDFR